jgi:head-tail adaptor
MQGELAGRMTERVVLERWQDARDVHGLAVGEWQMVETREAAVMAERVPDAGVAGDALHAVARWRVVLRAPAEVGLRWRLWWRGERLAVLSVLRDPAFPDRVELRCRSDG